MGLLSIQEEDGPGTDCGQGRARRAGFPRPGHWWGYSSHLLGSVMPLSPCMSVTAFGFSQNPQKYFGLQGLRETGQPRSRPAQGKAVV